MPNVRSPSSVSAWPLELRPQARFASDLHDTFHGQREFSIVDLNGYELNFAQPVKT